MALIKKQPGFNFVPRVYEEPATGDVIIGGDVYDRNTLLPKIGTPGISYFDVIDTPAVPGVGPYANSYLNSTGAASIFGYNQMFRQSYLMAPLTAGRSSGENSRNGILLFTANTLSGAAVTSGSYSNVAGITPGGVGCCLSGPRSISVNRTIKSNRTKPAITFANGSNIFSSQFYFGNGSFSSALGMRTDMFTRDWYEQKNASYFWYDSISNNVVASSDVGTLSYSGSSNAYGSQPIYQVWAGDRAGVDLIYRFTPTYQQGANNSSFITVGTNQAGVITLGHATDFPTYSSTPINIKAVTRSTNSSLSAVANIVYNSPANSAFNLVTLLTTTENNTKVFLYRWGGNTQVVGIRDDNVVENMTSVVTGGNTTFTFSVPSQMVRHHDANNVNNDQKISYYWHVSGASRYYPPVNVAYGANSIFKQVVVDNALETVTIRDCSVVGGHAGISNSVIMTDAVGRTHALWTDCRVIRTDVNPSSQKFLMISNVVTGQENDLSSTLPLSASITSNNLLAVGVYEISSSNSAQMDLVFNRKWNEILTPRPNESINNRNLLPWCIAPLNPEHTKMMVFLDKSTHVVKFDTTAKTLTETWYDHNSIITGAMWLDTGKVITDGWDMERIVIDRPQDDCTEQHVWSEDMIYKVDLIPANTFQSYTGSNISTTIDVSAYSSSGSREVTDLLLVIDGNANFDNGGKSKVVTTSNSAHVSEAITITGPGKVLFKVVEIEGS